MTLVLIKRQDGNRGLVARVLSRRRELIVVKLARQYATVPVELVAEQLSMPKDAALSFLQDIIRSKSLHAELEDDKVLKFAMSGFAEPQSVADGQIREHLEAQTRRFKGVQSRIVGLDSQLKLSKEFVEHARKMRKNKDQRQQGGAAGAEMGDGETTLAAVQSDEDENVMDVAY